MTTQPQSPEQPEPPRAPRSTGPVAGPASRSRVTGPLSGAAGPLFGVGVSSALAELPATLDLVDQADRDGLDMVSVSDHPYFADRIDAYAFLGAVLGRTERLAGWVNVSNLPTRPAPMLSRTLAGLSAVSGGRVAAGLGVGGIIEESAKLGAALLTPGQAVRAFEEAMQVIRALTGAAPGAAPVTFDGEFTHVRDLAPAAVPTPPIWTGSVGPKSLAATGRRADGWIPGHAADWLSPRFRQSRPVIDAAAAAAGRAPAEVATIYNFPGVITASAVARPRDEEGRWVGGSVAQWVEELTSAVLEHGAGGFTYFPAGGGSVPEAVARWAREVVPAVREAVARG